MSAWNLTCSLDFGGVKDAPNIELMRRDDSGDICEGDERDIEFNYRQKQPRRAQQAVWSVLYIYI